MRDAGITPVIKPQDAKLAPNECNFIVLQPPDMPPALAAKSIHGYCVAEPFNALGELRAGGKMLRMTGDVWKGPPCCVVVMHEGSVAGELAGPRLTEEAVMRLATGGGA